MTLHTFFSIFQRKIIQKLWKLFFLKVYRLSFLLNVFSYFLDDFSRFYDFLKKNIVFALGQFFKARRFKHFRHSFGLTKWHFAKNGENNTFYTSDYHQISFCRYIGSKTFQGGAWWHQKPHQFIFIHNQTCGGGDFFMIFMNCEEFI